MGETLKRIQTNGFDWWRFDSTLGVYLVASRRWLNLCLVSELKFLTHGRLEMGGLQFFYLVTLWQTWFAQGDTTPKEELKLSQSISSALHFLLCLLLHIPSEIVMQKF